MKLLALLASGIFAPAPVRASSADPSSAFDIDPAEAARNQSYDQPDRPQYHYTPMQGHIGDATGLIRYEGENHLFYMSDKWERRRNRHKRWGHAVSGDFVHWTELPSLLDPVLDHRPGSGSGIVDFNDTLGLQRGPEKTLAIFYTDYERGSCLATSTDAGRTWTRYAGNPVLAGARDMRDPRVFWYEPGRSWRMVRYERKGFAFYRSQDLRRWEALSRIDGFYECPDIFPLPVSGRTGPDKWVLMEADGGYRLGSFDGAAFHPETPLLRTEVGGRYYAPQTWTVPEPGGGRSLVQMGFIRYEGAPPLTWQNQMAFPVVLTLRDTGEGPRLYREPIPGLAGLRSDTRTWQDFLVGPRDNPLAGIQGDLLEIRADIGFGSARALRFTIRGRTLRYSADGRLEVDGAASDVPCRGCRVALQLLVDRSSLEIFLDGGRASFSKSVFFLHDRRDLGLAGEGGALRVFSLQVSGLRATVPSPGITP